MMVRASASHVLRLAPVSMPLAGRADEMERLRGAWRRAASGKRQLVLLAGEGGVGKTRLAAELACEVEADGATVRFGAWSPAGADPCEGLVEALGPAALSAGALRMDRVVMFDAVAEEVARLSPVLLVLDDLHRADRTSLLALRHLLDTVGRVAVLVVGAYRDAAVDRSHPLAELLAAVHDRPGVERMSVEGLAADAVAELVGDAELGSRLWRHSEGNPLVVGELLRLDALDAPLPLTFDELVARRLGRLGVGTGRVVEAAAVIGHRFTARGLATVTRLSEERVGSALREASDAGIVVEDPERPGTQRFAHDLVREAVERAVAPGRRVRLHLAAGRALGGEHGPAPAATVAWHFRAGSPVGGSAEAVRHSTRAGDHAMEMRAWDEAAGQYGHALAALNGARPGARADLLLALGDAQRLAGEMARARQSFLEAAEAARRCRDGTRLARAALALGQLSAVWGADPVLDQLAGEARTVLGSEAPLPASLLPRLDFSSDALYDAVDGTLPEPAVADPGPPPEGPPQPAPRGRSRQRSGAMLRARHQALAGPDRSVERLAAADELVALAAAIADDELAATGRGWRLVDLMELGRVAEADAERASHAEVAARLGQARHLRDAAVWAGTQALLEGRVSDARAAADEALVLGTAASDPDAVPVFWTQRWAMASEWGTPEEVGAAIEGCREQAAAAASPAPWRASLAVLLARRGDLDLAAEEMRRVFDRSSGALGREPGRLHPLVCLAEVAWTLGDASRAATISPLLEPFAERLALAGRGLACLGSVERACALAAAAGHRWDDAEGHFGRAIEVHRRIGALPLLARTHFERSRALTERGRKVDRRRASASLRTSHDLASRLGMERLAR